jgi:hypothetical protein
LIGVTRMVRHFGMPYVAASLTLPKIGERRVLFIYAALAIACVHLLPAVLLVLASEVSPNDQS